MTGCLAYADASSRDERLAFTATATEHVVVVDTVPGMFGSTPSPFTLAVRAVACDGLGESAACPAAAPFCYQNACVECFGPFACGASAPTCDSADTCVAGPTLCTGDDADDTTSPGDDGPSVARPLATPTGSTPTVVTKAVCNVPDTEADWYSLDVPAGGISLELTWAAGAGKSLRLELRGPDGEAVAYGSSSGDGYATINAATLSAGSYVAQVRNLSLGSDSTAVPYTLTARLPECATSLDCATAAPVCDGRGLCVAGPRACTGDDAADESTTGDDSPTVATVIAAPAVGAPTVVTGATCSSPDLEADWYRVTLPAGALGVELAVADVSPSFITALELYDAQGGLLDTRGVTSGSPGGFRTAALAAGTYYIMVDRFQPAATAAVAYTLTLRVPECDDDFDCSAGAPICGRVGTCVAGPSACGNDDDGEAGGDDGPAGARPLAAGVGQVASKSALYCGALGEVDHYRVDVGAGQGLTANLAWVGAAGLNLAITDDRGRRLGESLYSSPEDIELTYLPAGTYYVRVTGGNTGTIDYTLTTELTAAQTCASAADCAAEYATQVYRGDCTAAGACAFLEDGARAAGAACDSDGDCASGRCSYRLYEADAAESVCTTTCTTTADCAAVGAGLTCTRQGALSICVPACSTDLECGTSLGAAPDPGRRWGYMTCNIASQTCAP